MLNILKSALSRFRRDDRGSMTVEAVLILPILGWWYVGSLVFFDAYDARSVNLKASFTISDLLSRNQGDVVTHDDLDGMGRLFAYLTAGHGTDAAIRVTMVRCREDCLSGDRQLRRDWSYGTNGKPGLGNGDLPGFDADIPTLMKGERIIMVESFMHYDPAFDVGLSPASYENVVVTRPRFTGKICLEGTKC